MAAVMPLDRSYLDYNATAPLRPEALQAALAAMETTGNPSSVHAEGRAARRIVEDARSDVARLAGVSSRGVTFVSGGTEAANSALNPLFGGGRGAVPLERLIVGAGEHVCVLSGHRFPAAEIAPLMPDGRLDLDWLEAACRRPGRALLALQGANNETGVVQPVAEAAALVHAAGGFVFCDAVQMAGRISCDIAALGADALMLSAHKIGGPKGAGALATARPEIGLGKPLVVGGGQERGARAGT
ncbi:MAG TPA: aminotransferase class V-fold PLP-dependent enzyme, partial [Roseiarcus sp.]|nr:aminotransferase class V-fold PLP-dependent enzyme [Roseiarcus sp.]